MSSLTWVLLFGVPLVAIVVIIGFARYQASPVLNDEREKPQDDDPEQNETS
ncbi:hypothetical protein ACQEU5_17530 [Marinactinospora thermotolerans]|uniref:Uncharacterized protein n=1 Tax=Marinactinospora thermotolerans DSM 45154 TaxID=1122192 RepID=A0A1T4S692_9ACTN|nr:hypothetical protein [Marinactinospora thermotolerans]SKA23371.1 hypothetical protein SAMN02745673_03209 [Marinactinospora thermotolerans DSM 45154]